MKKTIRTGLALGVVVAAPTAWAGPYVTLGLAFASEEVTASNSGINHPTRCDRVLYADPSRAPVDAACTDNSVRALVSDSFNLGGAFAGTASIGYAWDRLRIEAEFLSRAHDGGVSRLIGEVDNPALQGKATEWSPDDPPYHRVSDFRSSQLLLNVVYEFGSGSTWSPFVGVGAGVARVKSHYRVSFLRRTLADGYVEAVGGDPHRPEDWQVAAAGTSSVINTQVSDEAFGYQIMAGVQRRLTEATSLLLTLRWSGIDDVSGEDIWDTIRSHRPVQADGVTPFSSTQDFRDIGSLSATLGLRHEF